MTKPDDSTLAPDDLRVIEDRARDLLNRASAWGTYPTPVDDILSAAKVRLAPTSIFDAAGILAYLKGKAEDASVRIKSAISKVFGVYDGDESIIHIDDTVAKSKQQFLKLHETAHHDLPTHRKLFRFFQDCEQTLHPDIADQFEREANNFARFALFQGDGFAKIAADHAFEIKTPIRLAKKFGASVYASAREFARTNHRACVVFVLEPIEFVEVHGALARVRRVEASPAYQMQFGKPDDRVITLDHALGCLLPIGRKMTKPTSISLTDRNGTRHDCVAEAFDTSHNIIILLYPAKDLRAKTIVFPATVSKKPAA